MQLKVSLREGHCRASNPSIKTRDVHTAAAQFTSAKFWGLQTRVGSIWFVQSGHRPVLGDAVALHLTERFHSRLQTTLAGVECLNLCFLWSHQVDNDDKVTCRSVRVTNLMRLAATWILVVLSLQVLALRTTNLVNYKFIYGVRQNGLIHVPGWSHWSPLIDCWDDACLSIAVAPDWLPVVSAFAHAVG